MIAVSHPTGNAFVRALLERLEKEGRLGRFFTTVNFSRRRQYPVPAERIETSPARELARLALSPFATPLTRHETGWASVDSVYRALDRKVAARVRDRREFSWVYAYEDGAVETFRAAREMGIGRAYELPIAYWETSRRLLREEAERLPQWSRTLAADSDEKMDRKSEELALADKIICPSRFVLESLPEEARKRCTVARFGSPVPHRASRAHRPYKSSAFRVLFAGAMTQRKGLADLFAAMKLLRRRDVELVVMGAALAPMEFYRKQYAGFLHERPRAREGVLALMETCDLLVLPSIVEGRALVQQEAMSRGLPLVATRNAGGEDLIDEGKTGFMVPIRAPEAIAAKIGQLADDRALREAMGEQARRKAAEYAWENYAAGISAALAS